MAQDTMNVYERFAAAISLEAVDRAPVFPILVSAAPRLYGITQAEAWRDHNKAREALIKCYQWGVFLTSLKQQSERLSSNSGIHLLPMGP